jgi:hypothetical protein
MRETSYKYLIRVIAALSILTIGLLLFLSIIDAATDVDVEAILDLQRSNLAVGAFTTVLGLTGPTSAMALWILMLYHWGTHHFKSAGQKRFWLAVLLLGNIGLAPVYYFVVFELGRTLRLEAHSVGA